jgi:hypothetical protein
MIPKAVGNIVQFKHEGDELAAKGTLNQVFARIYCCAKDEKELKDTISYIKNNLRIIDADGKNMIMNLFNEKEVYK